MGKLYIIATPIGNIEDITLRAIRILKEVDLILCENVSESHRLLKHYEIKTATTNYYSNSRLDKINKIIQMLDEGKSLALISDAGTPCVSDPGSLLVKRICEYAPTLTSPSFGEVPLKNTKEFGISPLSESRRGAGREGRIEIIPIPGPSAVTALYSVSGVLGNRFTFNGFIPQKKGRQTFIKNIIKDTKEKDLPIIFYESVHRFEKFLEEFLIAINLENVSEIENYVFTIGRELTKIHEQIVKGNILEIKSYFDNNKDKVRGEFVVLLEFNFKLK